MVPNVVAWTLLGGKDLRIQINTSIGIGSIISQHYNEICSTDLNVDLCETPNQLLAFVIFYRRDETLFGVLKKLTK